VVILPFNKQWNKCWLQNTLLRMIVIMAIHLWAEGQDKNVCGPESNYCPSFYLRVITDNTLSSIVQTLGR